MSVSLREDVAVLEPAARDPRRHDHDVPARRLRRGFALAIDDAYAQLRRAEDRFGDGANRERFSGAGAGDDAESLAGARKLENFLAVLALQQRVEVQLYGELDGLTRRARGCNDDDASRRGLRGRECFAIRRKVVIANVTQCRSVIPVGA